MRLTTLKCALFHHQYHVTESRSDGVSFHLIGGECTKCRRRWIRGIGTTPDEYEWAALAINPATREQRIFFSGDEPGPVPPEGFEWWQESYLERTQRKWVIPRPSNITNARHL